MSQLVIDTSSSSRMMTAANSVYVTARTAVSGTISTGTTNFSIGQSESAQVGVTEYTVYRTYLFFDTSTIPLNSNITSAALSFFCTSLLTGVNFDLVIQNGGTVYPRDPVVGADFNYLYYQSSSSGGQLAALSINAGAYNQIPLNSNGLLWLTKGGTTKFCLRISTEITGIAPAVDNSQVVTCWPYSKGTGYMPYLTVNYNILTTPAKSSITG